MKEALRTISMAGGIILLAGIAAWMGLAHGCEAPLDDGVIAGRVTIAQDLVSRVRDTDVLFIIVRRPQGPRRPLAVQRIDRPLFPVTFEITNKDVMIQGSALKGMVEVLARLDKDGSAGPPQAGDLEGQFERNPTLVGGRDIEIRIDKAY